MMCEHASVTFVGYVYGHALDSCNKCGAVGHRATWEALRAKQGANAASQRGPTRVHTPDATAPAADPVATAASDCSTCGGYILDYDSLCANDCTGERHRRAKAVAAERARCPRCDHLVSEHGPLGCTRITGIESEFCPCVRRVSGGNQ